MPNQQFDAFTAIVDKVLSVPRYSNGRISGLWGKEYAEFKMKQPSPYGTPQEMIPVYPECSTDWAAAGPLISALMAMRIRIRPDFNPYIVEGASFGVALVWTNKYCTQLGHAQEYADSFPRALCLAVAALAEASGKEASNG